MDVAFVILDSSLDNLESICVKILFTYQLPGDTRQKLVLKRGSFHFSDVPLHNFENNLCVTITWVTNLQVFHGKYHDDIKLSAVHEDIRPICCFPLTRQLIQNTVADVAVSKQSAKLRPDSLTLRNSSAYRIRLKTLSFASDQLTTRLAPKGVGGGGRDGCWGWGCPW